MGTDLPHCSPPHPLTQSGLVAENYNFVSQIEAAIKAAKDAASMAGALPPPLSSDEAHFLRLLEEVRDQERQRVRFPSTSESVVSDGG